MRAFLPHLFRGLEDIMLVERKPKVKPKPGVKKAPIKTKVSKPIKRK